MYSCDAALCCSASLLSLQCHVIFRKHNNMMIYNQCGNRSAASYLFGTFDIFFRIL